MTDDQCVIVKGEVQLGRYISDVQNGEDLGAVAFTLTPLFVQSYLRGAGETERPIFRDKGVVPPTMMHVAKLRLLTTRFPAGPGPFARMHYHFDCKYHSLVHIGERITVSGICSKRYIKRDRPYMELELEVRAEDARLVWTAVDTSLLKLRQNS